jgi:DNA-binding transcriptional LysR family regulator
MRGALQSKREKALRAAVKRDTVHFDIVDFRLFINIAEQASFTRGAERSFLSVPAASNRIKALELAIGCRLLTRVNQGVVLTDAGKVYLQHARSVLKELELLTDDLQAFASGITGHLRIQANTTTITEFLPPVLGKFLREHPDVKIAVQQRLSDEIVRNVRDDVADLGLISGDLVTAGVETKRFATSRMVAIAPLGHPVSGLKEVAFKDLLAYDIVTLLEDTATYKWFTRQASSLHVPMKVRVQVANWDSLCRMVEAGVGIGFVPIVVLSGLKSENNVHVIELLDDWSVRDYQICAKQFSALPAFATAFVQALMQEYAADRSI